MADKQCGGIGNIFGCDNSLLFFFLLLVILFCFCSPFFFGGYGC
ncbi:MAG: hypothetical protein ACOYVK_15780 [Bacillota bacterium]